MIYIWHAETNFTIGVTGFVQIGFVSLAHGIALKISFSKLNARQPPNPGPNLSKEPKRYLEQVLITLVPSSVHSMTSTQSFNIFLRSC